VLWRRTCGDTRFVVSDGHFAWAAFECIYRDMNRMTGNRRIARKLAIVAIALGLWGALVLLFAAPLALRGPISWREAVSFGGSFWALWLLFLPVVAWLSFRFPIERRRLLRNVGLHLLVCLLMVVTNRATFRAVARIFPVPQRSEAPGRPPDLNTDRPETQHQRRLLPSPPPRRALDLVGPPNALGVFLGLRVALDVLVYWSLVGVCQAITNFRSSQRQVASVAYADQSAFSFQHAEFDCRVGLREPASGRRDAGRLERVAAPFS